jgi:RHS repeat-associated protein
VDSSGSLQNTDTYDAFGIKIASTEPVENRYLYAGEQLDPDLGLYYLRARYYSSDKGRFWTTDPFAGFQTQPLSLNNYLYANANPINVIDPSGKVGTAELAVAGSIATYLASQLLLATVKAIAVTCAAEAVYSTTANVVFNQDTSSRTSPCSWRGKSKRRVIIGQTMRRVYEAAPAYKAEAFNVGQDHIAAGPVGWVRIRMSQGAEFIDIGYDSDNRGAPTVYDLEVDAMAGYPRKKVPWPGSMGGLPDGHRP